MICKEFASSDTFKLSRVGSQHSLLEEMTRSSIALVLLIIFSSVTLAREFRKKVLSYMYFTF